MSFNAWIRSRFEAAMPCTWNRRRTRKPARVSVLASEVQVLESRALLTVTYHGGALLTAVEAQAVYLGSNWSSNSSLQTQSGQLDQFVSTVVTGAYMDMLTSAGYNVGRGSASTGAVDDISLNMSTSRRGGVTDAQIQFDLQAMINQGQVQAPDANRLYIVFVEPGVIIHLGSDASNTGFLGSSGNCVLRLEKNADKLIL